MCFNQGDRLCPPDYYWQTRIFRPSEGPTMYIALLITAYSYHPLWAIAKQNDLWGFFTEICPPSKCEQKRALIRAYLMSRTLLSTISNIKRGLIGQVYQGCQRHQPKTSRDFLGTNYRQLETFIMTPSIFMVMKKEMNFPVAFKLKAFIYHYLLFWKPLFLLPMESSRG